MADRGVVGGLGGLGYGVVFGELAAFEAGPRRRRARRSGVRHRRASIPGRLGRLHAMVIPAGLQSGPLVTVVLVPDRGEDQSDGVGPSMNAVA